MEYIIVDAWEARSHDHYHSPTHFPWTFLLQRLSRCSRCSYESLMMMQPPWLASSNKVPLCQCSNCICVYCADVIWSLCDVLFGPAIIFTIPVFCDVFFFFFDESFFCLLILLVLLLCVLSVAQLRHCVLHSIPAAPPSASLWAHRSSCQEKHGNHSNSSYEQVHLTK